MYDLHLNMYAFDITIFFENIYNKSTHFQKNPSLIAFLTILDGNSQLNTIHLPCKHDPNNINKKKLDYPFLWMGFNCLKALCSQKFLVLILSTSEG